jgi:hypothetical protein
MFRHSFSVAVDGLMLFSFFFGVVYNLCIGQIIVIVIIVIVIVPSASSQ